MVKRICVLVKPFNEIYVRLLFFSSLFLQTPLKQHLLGAGAAFLLLAVHVETGACVSVTHACPSFFVVAKRVGKYYLQHWGSHYANARGEEITCTMAAPC